MNASIQLSKVKRGPVRRHDARVQRYSRDYLLLQRLDGLAIDEGGCSSLVDHVCWDAGVESPLLKFHARRSQYTGATEPPRDLWIRELGESQVLTREGRTGRQIPLFGAIRLGRQTTLMTLAHELGHHLVFALERPNTPAHGKIWISRFDEAATAITTHLNLFPQRTTTKRT